MRTSNEYCESLKKTEAELEKGSQEVIISFFFAGLVPVLQAIRIESMESYNAITSLAVLEPIFRYMDLSECFKAFLDRAIKIIYREVEPDDVSDERRRSFITDICAAAFAKDPRVADDAQERLGYPAHSLPTMAARALQ